MPEISVIIPTYNYGKFLPETLDSVLNQTYQDFEIIVVDDGSTDNTAKIAHDYIKKYPDKIRYLFQKNQGCGAACNRGIRESAGNYIALLGADDIWYPEKLELQIHYLKEHPDMSMVFTEFEYIDSNGRTLGFSDRRKKIPIDGMILKYYIKHPLILPSSVLIKRQVFDRVGLFDETTYCEDADMFFRITKFFQVGLIEKSLLKYRRHNMNFTSDQTKQIKRNEDILKVYKKFLNEEREFAKENKEAVKRRFSRIYNDYVEALLRCNKFKEARFQIQNYLYYAGLTPEVVTLFFKIILMGFLGDKIIDSMRRIKRKILLQQA